MNFILLPCLLFLFAVSVNCQFVYPGYWYARSPTVSNFINRKGCNLTWPNDGAFCCQNGDYMFNRSDIAAIGFREQTIKLFDGSNSNDTLFRAFATKDFIIQMSKNRSFIDFSIVYSFAAWRNQIGLFLLSSNNTIKPNSMMDIFKDMKVYTGCHVYGDTVTIGPFSQGDRLGFYIKPEGASNKFLPNTTASLKTSLDSCLIKQNFSNPDVYACYRNASCPLMEPNSAYRSNPSLFFYSLKQLNYDKKAHVAAVMNGDDILVGFKDSNLTNLPAAPNYRDHILAIRISVGNPQSGLFRLCPNCSSSNILNATCDYSTGKCSCNSTVSPNIKFDDTCTTCFCNCSNNGVCNCTTGSCNCQNGYFGSKCECSVSDPQKLCYGPNAKWNCLNCTCLNGTSTNMTALYTNSSITGNVTIQLTPRLYYDIILLNGSSAIASTQENLTIAFNARARVLTGINGLIFLSANGSISIIVKRPPCSVLNCDANCTALNGVCDRDTGTCVYASKSTSTSSSSSALSSTSLSSSSTTFSTSIISSSSTTFSTSIISSSSFSTSIVSSSTSTLLDSISFTETWSQSTTRASETTSDGSKGLNISTENLILVGIGLGSTILIVTAISSVMVYRSRRRKGRRNNGSRINMSNMSLNSNNLQSNLAMSSNFQSNIQAAHPNYSNLHTPSMNLYTPPMNLYTPSIPAANYSPYIPVKNVGSTDTAPVGTMPNNGFVVEQPKLNYKPASSQTRKPQNMDPTQNVTQNVTTGPIAIPGYLNMKLGLDFDIPEFASKIGKGGTSSIFKGILLNSALLARNNGSQEVAIKVSEAKPNEDEDRNARRKLDFMYEIAIMNSLPPCPNIVQFIGFEDCPERNCIVMRNYASNLGNVIMDKSIPMTVELICKIGYDVASGMETIHSKGILHLDMKPNNILLDINADGSFTCVICDFGFASLIGDSQSRVVRGLNVPKTTGITFRYCAPEIFERIAMGDLADGRVHDEADKKIDVYAFAITIYETAFRKSPWNNLGKKEIAQKVMLGERPELPAHGTAEEIHFRGKPKFMELITRSWSSSPDQRPPFSEIKRFFQNK